MVAPHSERKAYDVGRYRYLVDVTHSHDGITVKSEDLGLEEGPIQIGGIRNLVARCLGVLPNDVMDATEDYIRLDTERGAERKKVYIQAEA
jgi:hypothetical protein